MSSSHPESCFPAVEMRDISKRFGTVAANKGVNLRIETGTIQAIIGENGAGKSTAMNILYGMYPPDAGQILVNGTLRSWPSPLDAIRAGVGMVHQHFMLAAPHSVLENVVLGAESSRFGILNRTSARAQILRLASQHGLAVPPDARVEELPIGIQQRVEILKLLYRGAHILILDEPTAVLTPQESDELFRNLKELRDQGKTIILITHKLREVLNFAEGVTVMRSGEVVADLQAQATDVQQLAGLMVGRRVNLRTQPPPAKPGAGVALKIDNLSLESAAGRRKLDDVSFDIRQGEIVGVAGVQGNGQSELIQALLQPREQRHRTAGRMEIFGVDVTNWTTAAIRDLGVSFIPEDRQHEGLLLNFPLVENFALGLHRLSEFGNAGFLSWKALTDAADQRMDRFDVRPRKVRAAARSLSGGNQQKMVIAREFYRKTKLLIAAQPTRGVDIGAVEFIHEAIIRLRDEGAGVLLISSDLEEILTLSDRILVMFGGKISGEFKRGEVDEQELGLRMSGAKG